MTAASHRRAFLVEVMGRDCGYLALVSGIAGGAEAPWIPEVPTNPEAVAIELIDAYNRGKSNGLVVVLKGLGTTRRSWRSTSSGSTTSGWALTCVDDAWPCQRGGAPGAFDRFLGKPIGWRGDQALARGEYGVLVGTIKSGNPDNAACGGGRRRRCSTRGCSSWLLC